MATHVIKMPDIGEGIAEVEIVEWHVAVGDTVAEDQVLADVMTDKASVEIPSPVAGQVVSLGGQVGDVLAVGAELIVLQSGQAAAAQTENAPLAAVAATAAKADTVASTHAGASSADTKRSPASQSQAAADTTRDQAVRSAGSAAGAGPAKVLASPSVRQRARHLDIDLQQFADTAAGSPVTHRDLDNYLLARSASTQAAAGRALDPARSLTEEQTERGDVTISMVGMRRRIADKMLTSKRSIPHFSYVEEIDVTELEALRQSLNANSGSSTRLTLLPFLVRALVLGVRLHPEINARYDEDNEVILQSGAVHLGIATQTESGLMVPVLRHAERLDLWSCASEIQRLADAARQGRARQDELSGSTLTLTSLGALGGVVSTPIINHPEVAIVGVNRIMDKLALRDGVPVVRKTMNLSSSFDHRIVDGMNAARFIQEVRRLLETPALLFVDTP